MDSENVVSSPEIVLLTWFEVNKKRLLIGGGVLVAAAFLTVTVRHFERQKELDASAELAALRAPLGDRLSRVPSEKFFAVAQRYSGTEAASRAQLMGAEALFSEGKYPEAQAQFQTFLGQHAGHPMVASAALGVAACLDAAGKTADAAAKYQEVTRQYATAGAVAAQARLALGRIFESQGRFKEANALYREMSQTARMTGYNGWIEEAMSRVMQLEKAHPDLVAAKELPPSLTAGQLNTPPPANTPSTPAPLLLGTNSPAGSLQPAGQKTGK